MNALYPAGLWEHIQICNGIVHRINNQPDLQGFEGQYCGDIPIPFLDSLNEFHFLRNVLVCRCHNEFLSIRISYPLTGA